MSELSSLRMEVTGTACYACGRRAIRSKGANTTSTASVIVTPRTSSPTSCCLPCELQGQSHCLLLVEPVLLPDLGHTGVTREALPGDRPLFYPNGCKNRGLSAIVRNSLYHSASAPRLTADSSNAFDRMQQQTTPSDWAARRRPLSSRGSSLAENRTETPTSAIPAGQWRSLSLPSDMWENPPVAGAEGGRPKPGGAARTLSRGADDNKTMAQHGRAKQRRGRAVPKGLLAARAAGATRARHQEERQQQQQQQPLQRSKSSNLPLADPKHSTATSRTITAPTSDCFDYDRVDSTRLDAAGRDSEWVAERRAADAEAREVLGTLKRNSSRLWFLVGGAV